MTSNRNSSVLLRGLLFFALISANVGLTACASQKKFETTVLTITRADSTVVEITVEIARTDEERATGLMNRKKLPDGNGMIFIFERDAQHSFWMKNTFIPLSIAFIMSDGRIAEIKDMQPHNENSVAPSRSVRYALEVPQGWFGRVGIKPGDRVEINF